MPELPEVQTTVAGIKPYLIDTMIERLVIRQPQLRWPVTQGIEATAKGLKIENVTRRAKYIIVSLTNGSFLIHLGMSGSLRLITSTDILKKHDHKIKFDIIVSNPPYVHKKEKNLISNVVLKNEPSEAIFVNSDDDLLFYKTIINFSKSHLKQKGIIYFECHKETINQVKNLLIINKFTDIQIKKDSFGINRMIKANSYGDA